jgi:hypothetical protein
VGQFPPVLVSTLLKNFDKRCKHAVGKPRLDMRLLIEFKVWFYSIWHASREVLESAGGIR